MKTSKYQQIVDILGSTSICGTRLVKNPENIQVSLVFPEIQQISQKGKEQFSGYMQICLIVLDQENKVIQHQNVEDFNQYLKNNINGDTNVFDKGTLNSSKVKCVKIHTIQVSKTGKLQEGKFNTIIESGKNIGKKSETTILQQAIQESQKKYNQHTSNKNDQYPHFMLLDLYKYSSKLNSSEQESINKLSFPQFIQRKYDGLRCGIMQQNNKITLISRGHKEFTSLTHIERDICTIFEYISTNVLIAKQLKDICQVDFVSSVLLDGELYLHNKSLQTINSLIRNSKQTAEKSNIQFIIYDVDLTMSSNENLENNRQKQIKLPFHIRNSLLLLLSQIIDQLSIKSIQIAPTQLITSDQQLQMLFQQFIDQKYEGAVIRSPNSLYCYSLNKKRSNDTLKYKLKLDMEVQIINYSDGSGKDANCIIFECQLIEDSSSKERFQVVQNTTYDARKQLFSLLQQKPQYLEILKLIPLNIEYSVLSDQGIPQQPRAIYFRTESINIQIPDDLLSIIQQ